MLRWLVLVVRLVVGGVWIVAGALKVTSPQSSVTAVRAYQLLPTGLADVVGKVLPAVELIVGVCLVFGVVLRVTGSLSALMQLTFVIGIASVWARGIEINCGCFGNGGANPDAASSYPWEIARDIGLCLGSLLVAWHPRSPLALDGLLFPQRVKGVYVEEGS